MPAIERRSAAWAIVLAIGVAVASLLAACSPEPTGGDASVLDGILTLSADEDGAASLALWTATSSDEVDIREIALPGPATAWVSVGRASVLAATNLDGTVHTSDPVDARMSDDELAELDWRPVEATDPDGDALAEPAWFATWDPEGGRYAAISGDLPAGSELGLALVDPTTHGLLELTVDQPLLAAPPVWLDDDRVALIGGATTEPTALIVDATTGAIEVGPTGDRRIATSLDTDVVATSAGPGSSVDIAATSAWLEGSDASTGSIDAPDEDTTAISMALDRTGVRLAIVWVDRGGSVRLTVHDGTDGWRRVEDRPLEGVDAAAVAWLR
jgi:hypothetical protein